MVLFLQAPYNIAKYQRQVVKQKQLSVSIVSPQIRVLIKQKDERSYIEVVKEKPVRNIIYREWLSHRLVGGFSRGTNYAKIKNKMPRTLHNMEGFQFLGASMAILTFKTKLDMQFAVDEEKDFLENYFEELRP